VNDERKKQDVLLKEHDFAAPATINQVSLKLQTGFTGSISQSFDTAMIGEATTVKDHAFQVKRKRPGSNHFAKLDSTGLIGGKLFLAHLFFHGGSGKQGALGNIVNDLNVNVFASAADA